MCGGGGGGGGALRWNNPSVILNTGRGTNLCGFCTACYLLTPEDMDTSKAMLMYCVDRAFSSVIIHCINIWLVPKELLIRRLILCIACYIRMSIWLDYDTYQFGHKLFVKCEITDPFPNFYGCTIHVWGWINNFIPHITGNVMAYPCWD